MNRTGQLTLTDAEGRSLDLGVVEGEMFIGVDYGARESTSVAVLARSMPTGSFVAAEIHVPRQRSPGPHPYRWPTPRR